MVDFPQREICSVVFIGMTTLTPTLTWNGCWWWWWGGAGNKKVFQLKTQGHWLLQMWNNNGRQVWRFRLEGSGNVVLFVLSERYVSSRFSMLVEELGPPLLKVFHSGESSDIPGIQRVCRLCLWRRWNTILCFTTIRLIDKADLNWL